MFHQRRLSSIAINKSLNMARILSVLLLASVFSFAYSEYYSDQLSNVSTSIIVGDNKTVRLDQYLDYDKLERLISKLNRNYREIFAATYLMKPSVFIERNIFAVHISRDVRKKRKFLKPMFKLVANVHGTDAVGYSLMTSLMQYLVYSDGYDPRVTRLLNTTDIWIIPTVDPDAFSVSEAGCEDPDEMGDTNWRGVDLDNDYPYPESQEDIQEPESKHIMDMIKHMSFVLSGNLQGGAVVASYPYDSAKFSNGLTPDDAMFKKLAKGYAERNSMMSPGNACNRTFPGGITNGMNWKEKTSSMQDANYHLSNCFEITLYLSCCKYPPAADLPKYWHANLESMLSFIESTRQGIFGKIVDSLDKPVKQAVVEVAGNEKVIRGTNRGEYWRLLPPGHYTVTARAPATLEQTFEVDVNENNTYVQLDFILQRQGVYGHVTLEPKNVKSKKVIITVKKIDIQPIVEDSSKKNETSLQEIGQHGRNKQEIKKNNVEEINKNNGTISVEGPKTLEGLKIEVATDEEFLQFLPLGEYNVTASGEGVTPRTKSVNLTKEEPYVRVQFTLVSFLVTK